MEWAALFKIVQSWGPSALSSVLVVVVLYLIKLVKSNSDEDKKRSTESKLHLEEKIKELKGGIDKTLDDHGKRISCIEHDYVKRETFYKDLGGWKDDINRLSNQISSLSHNFMEKILEIWKEGKKD